MTTSGTITAITSTLIILFRDRFSRVSLHYATPAVCRVLHFATQAVTADQIESRIWCLRSEVRKLLFPYFVTSSAFNFGVHAQRGEF